MEKFDDEKLRKIVSKRIGLFKQKPEVAVYRPKVTSRHIYGLYTETSVRDHTVKADYAGPAGGTNLAPNPIELLLSALAACIESAFYEFALHEGIKIKSMTVDVEGELDLRGLFMVDDTVPSGFNNIKYHMDIESGDNEEKVRKLAEKVIAHCPVMDSLVRPVKIDGEININK
ncbi:OsmC-like protein [bacterium BMS3Abin07]|nr:OsmC-like protein [bacterium BMS3Abin07]GBE31603.1 OsmC-like protein [bacterium BMS3Bbin05]HDO21715.1 OsmC family peroxiredoxin [Nitrospirota bacterium]HDZ87070.1 OsmC family peroxiredoxin [Nitrospirota bacterium]